MIKVEIKGGIPFINGIQVSYDNEKIRCELHPFFKENEIIALPKKYNYIVVNEIRAKIIYRDPVKTKKDIINDMIKNLEYIRDNLN